MPLELHLSSQGQLVIWLMQRETSASDQHFDGVRPLGRLCGAGIGHTGTHQCHPECWMSSKKWKWDCEITAERRRRVLKSITSSPQIRKYPQSWPGFIWKPSEIRTIPFYFTSIWLLILNLSKFLQILISIVGGSNLQELHSYPSSTSEVAEWKTQWSLLLT